jgi:hypothetical protein
VEHTCQRCNSVVRDSVPFCPNCRAPQIRVRIPEAGPEGPGTHSPPDIPTLSADPAALRGKTEWHNPANLNFQIALRTAASGGALGAIAGIMPLRAAFVVILPLAGALCVALYRRRTFIYRLPRRAGFRLGALTGLFASAIWLALSTLATLASHGESELREAMVRSIHQAQDRAADPQTREAFSYFLSTQGMVVMLILGTILVVIAFVLLGGLGGALAAALSGTKTHSE